MSYQAIRKIRQTKLSYINTKQNYKTEISETTFTKNHKIVLVNTKTQKYYQKNPLICTKIYNN